MISGRTVGAPGSCVVSGAAAGIGRAIVDSLVAHGWHVVAVDQDEAGLDELVVRYPSVVAPLCFDVADPTWGDAAAATAVELAPLWGWVNNAAIDSGQAATEVTKASVRRQISVNVEGIIWGCQAALRVWRATGAAGSIVNIGSIQGHVPLPGAFVYAGSKGFVSAATRQIAVEFAGDGIRANVVSPGAIDTDMSQRYWSAQSDPAAAQLSDAWLSPMGRIGQPHEVASAVAWLLSTEAAFITGHELVIDGGASVRLISGRPLAEAGPDI